MAILKPLSGMCGSFYTDSNFKKVFLSKKQVNLIAKRRLKQNKIYGCKKVFILDKGTHWAISIC